VIKTSFLNSHQYTHPTYSRAITYSGSSLNLKNLQEQIYQLDINESHSQIILDLKTSTLAEIAFLQQQGELSDGNKMTSEVLALNEQMFGRPTIQETLTAHNFLQQNSAQQVQKKLTYESLISVLQQTLEQEGLTQHKWRVATKQHGPIAVEPMLKQIIVPTSARYFSQQEIERLAIHEITVHTFRSFNGELVETKTGIPLKHKWPSYLATEEGLASFIEIQSGYKDTNALRKYAGRLLAVNAAFNEESFNQIFDLLVSHQFEQSDAFDIVWRCFRRGGYLKDGEYWKGLHQIQQIHNSTPARIKRLFAGKVAHQYFHLVENQIPQELYDQLKLPVCLR